MASGIVPSASVETLWEFARWSGASVPLLDPRSSAVTPLLPHVDHLTRFSRTDGFDVGDVIPFRHRDAVSVCEPGHRLVDSTFDPLSGGCRW